MRRFMIEEVMRMEESYNNMLIQEVVNSYSDMLIRIAYQHTGSMSDAEDIVQEAFIKFLKAPPFTDGEHRKAWFIRITINLCKDLNKSFWRRKILPLSETIQVREPDENGLLEELRNLPGHYRDTLYLYYFEEYSVPEIAELLNKKENTVSSWLTRGRKRMQMLLEEEQPKPDRTK